MTIRRLGCAGFFLLSLMSMGARVARADDWLQLGLNSSRGRSSTEVSGAAFQSAWQARVSSGPIVSSPTTADGYVLIAGSEGELTALRAADGVSVWAAQADGPVDASLAIDRGRLFVPTLSGRLQAFRLADGQALWSRDLGGQNFGSPTLLGDSLVIAAGSPGQAVLRLSSATGETQWQTAPGAVVDLVSSSPALAGGYALFGMNGGRFQSLNVATGETAWAVDTTGSVGMSSPLIVASTAYLLPGGRAASIYAVDMASGQVQPGWPVTLADPGAPDPGSFRAQRFAVSSPVSLGALVAAVVRFDYDMRPESDGQPGLHLLREFLAALDAQTGRVAFMAPLGERTASTINDVPALGLSPTPVVFCSAGGPLVAAPSSVAPALGVFDAAGDQLASLALSGSTRSSPVLSNGMLFVATDAGLLEAFQSTVNHPPAAPARGFSPADDEVVSSPAPTLRWAAATDAEGGPLRYQVRVDSDGELLESWLFERSSDGASVTIPAGTLRPGGSYVYAVRARDAQGAWSPWSAPHILRLAATPTVEIAGTTYDSLEQAIGAAAPGATINLGPGTLHLAASLELPHGVSLLGAGAHLTTVDAAGLGAGLEVRGGRGEPSVIEGLAVSGAEVGVLIAEGDEVTLRHLVVRDGRTAGVRVEAGAAAQIVNATIVGNGVGVEGRGAVAVRNSIVTGNEVGFLRSGDSPFESRYNDLVANAAASYRGVTPGPGDLTAAVTFRSTAAKDFHLMGVQTTTDGGDPADDFASEPAPNGGRVNMGAFGGTPEAEASAAASASPPATADPAPSAGDGGGCAVAGDALGGGSTMASLLLAVVLTATRRRRTRGGR